MSLVICKIRKFCPYTIRNKLQLQGRAGHIYFSVFSVFKKGKKKEKGKGYIHFTESPRTKQTKKKEIPRLLRWFFECFPLFLSSSVPKKHIKVQRYTCTTEYCIYLLTTGLGTCGASCHRWDCPCASLTKVYAASSPGFLSCYRLSASPVKSRSSSVHEYVYFERLFGKGEGGACTFSVEFGTVADRMV